MDHEFEAAKLRIENEELLRRIGEVTSMCAACKQRFYESHEAFLSAMKRIRAYESCKTEK